MELMERMLWYAKSKRFNNSWFNSWITKYRWELCWKTFLQKRLRNFFRISYSETNLSNAFKTDVRNLSQYISSFEDYMSAFNMFSKPSPEMNILLTKIKKCYQQGQGFLYSWSRYQVKDFANTRYQRVHQERNS